MTRFVRRCVQHGVELKETEVRERNTGVRAELALDVDLSCPFGHAPVKWQFGTRLSCWTLWDTLMYRCAARIVGDSVTWLPPYDSVFGEPETLAGRNSLGIIARLARDVPASLLGERKEMSAFP